MEDAGWHTLYPSTCTEPLCCSRTSHMFTKNAQIVDLYPYPSYFPCSSYTGYLSVCAVQSSSLDLYIFKNIGFLHFRHNTMFMHLASFYMWLMEEHT